MPVPGDTLRCPTALAIAVLLVTLSTACGSTGGTATEVAVPPAQTAPTPTPRARPEIDPLAADSVELDARLKLAIALNNEAEWRAAMEHLEVLKHNWSGLWTVQLEYAQASYRLGGEPETVVAALQRSIELREVNPRAHHILGQVYEDSGDLALAETHYRLSSEQRGTDVAPYLGLARVLSAQGRPNDAVDVLLSVIERRGSQLRLVVQLANAYEDAGRDDDALVAWRLVAANHVDPLKGHVMLFRYLKRKGHTEEARAVAETIAELKAARTTERNLRPLRPSMN